MMRSNFAWLLTLHLGLGFTTACTQRGTASSTTEDSGIELDGDSQAEDGQDSDQNESAEAGEAEGIDPLTPAEVTGSEDSQNTADNGADDQGENADDSDEAEMTGDGGEIPKFDLEAIPDFSIEPEGCDIDFLFVIDNSGSMADEQDNLAQSVPDFVGTVTSEIPNLHSIHLGVVTTQAYRENGAGCQAMGGLVTETGTLESSMRVCTPYASDANYMTEDDDLVDKFGCAAQPGTGDGQYGDERPMEALEKAISGPLLDPGACNEGFLRDDALLVVTVITDEEDDSEQGGVRGSPGDPADWYAKVLAAKADDDKRVVVLGLIGTEDSTECDPLVPTGAGNVLTGAEVSPRLAEFVGMFGARGFVGDVCAPNYDTFFEEAVSVIDFACDQLPPG